MTASHDVRCADQIVRFRGGRDAPELLAFLQAYFEPYFRFERAVADERPRWSVDVHVAPAPADMPDGDAPFVDVDRSGGFLRCGGRLAQIGAARRVLLVPFGVAVEIDTSARTVTVWGETEAALRIPCLRVLEDLMTHQLELAGGVFVHASAVVANGRAVLLCGNKGAGKTSGLCKLLQAFNVAPMANDNCLLRFRDGVLHARGWPGFFKADIALVAMHPELGRDFPGSLRPLLEDPAALWNVYDKVPLYPRQAAARFGADVCVEAPVGCIVFPSFDPDHPSELVPADAIEAAALLEDFVHGSAHPNHPDWMAVGTPSAERRAEHLATVLGALGDVDLFRLRWAPSYEDLLSCIPELRPIHTGVVASRTDVAPDAAWPALPEAT